MIYDPGLRIAGEHLLFTGLPAGAVIPWGGYDSAAEEYFQFLLQPDSDVAGVESLAFGAKDGENGWVYRKGLCADVIRSRQPDVLRGQMRGQYSLKSSQDVAGSCEPAKDSPNESGQPNVLTFNALGSKQRKSAKRCGSRPGGI